MNQPQIKPIQTRRSPPDEFITWLYTLAEPETNGSETEQKRRSRDKRATLAALRRGLGRSPGVALEMHRYVASWSQRGRSNWEQDAHYLIASLFALHSKYTPVPKSEDEEKTIPLNMGNHFAALSEDSELEPGPAIERRFNSLLASPPEGLYRTLQQAISMLKTKEVAINWHQLFKEIKRWENAEQRIEIQRHWARAFWGTFASRQAAARKAAAGNTNP